MEKFCVFCGKPPESKNREHVIPMWLIEMTGDPNRQVFLGRDWTSDTLEKRRYSFDSFAFPACASCNGTYSQLEARTQTTMIAMQSRQAVSAGQLSSFFDWLDKVRIGLWLGMIYLNRNHRGISPGFHIQDRIGSKDRVVVIYAIEDDNKTQLVWSATDGPLFQSMPSCFTLMVNNLLFLNVSFDFLLSKRFGFPYPKERHVRDEGGENLEMTAGSEHHTPPLMLHEYSKGGTSLWQPMIPWQLLRSDDGEPFWRELYDSDFVRANCMDFAEGRGRVFHQRRGSLVPYPSEPSLLWIPYRIFSRGEILYKTGLDAGNILEAIYRDHASFDKVTEERREFLEREVGGALKLHQAIMGTYAKQRKLFY